jgi:hypothetical protein
VASLATGTRKVSAVLTELLLVLDRDGARVHAGEDADGGAEVEL